MRKLYLNLNSIPKINSVFNFTELLKVPMQIFEKYECNCKLYENFGHPQKYDIRGHLAKSIQFTLHKLG